MSLAGLRPAGLTMGPCTPLGRGQSPKFSPSCRCSVASKRRCFPGRGEGHRRPPKYYLFPVFIVFPAGLCLEAACWVCRAFPCCRLRCGAVLLFKANPNTQDSPFCIKPIHPLFISVYLNSDWQCCESFHQQKARQHLKKVLFMASFTHLNLSSALNSSHFLFSLVDPTMHPSP